MQTTKTLERYVAAVSPNPTYLMCLRSPLTKIVVKGGRQSDNTRTAQLTTDNYRSQVYGGETNRNPQEPQL